MSFEDEIALIVYKSHPKGFDDYFNRICEELKRNGYCLNTEGEHEVCSNMYRIWSIIERRYL